MWDRHRWQMQIAVRVQVHRLCKALVVSCCVCCSAVALNKKGVVSKTFFTLLWTELRNFKVNLLVSVSQRHSNYGILQLWNSQSIQYNDCKEKNCKQNKTKQKDKKISGRKYFKQQQVLEMHEKHNCLVFLWQYL